MSLYIIVSQERDGVIDASRFCSGRKECATGTGGRGVIAGKSCPPSPCPPPLPPTSPPENASVRYTWVKEACAHEANILGGGNTGHVVFNCLS